MDGDITLSSGLVWALGALIIPAFWITLRRQDAIRTEAAINLQKAVADFDAKISKAQMRSEQNAEKLNAYKLEVAQKYASVSHLQDVENRIMNALEKIDKKIDARSHRDVCAGE